MPPSLTDTSCWYKEQFGDAFRGSWGCVGDDQESPHSPVGTSVSSHVSFTSLSLPAHCGLYVDRMSLSSVCALSSSSVLV